MLEERDHMSDDEEEEEEGETSSSSFAAARGHGRDLEAHEDHQVVHGSRRLDKSSSESTGEASVDIDDSREFWVSGLSATERREIHRNSLFYYSLDRQLAGGSGRRRSELPPPLHLAESHLSETLPNLLRAHEYDMGTVNKVFASQWLNEQHIVMGTKCNKLLVLDLNTGKLTRIPSLTSSFRSQAADCPCGIHAIACNPSKTLLATGGENTNDLAVYKLPTFDPAFLGEDGHRDWIFDISWIDDEFCVSGSRDNKLAVWRISPEDNLLCEGECQPSTQRINSAPVHVTDSSVASDMIIETDLPVYRYGKPVAVRACASADRIRALSYNEPDMELCVLSLNSKIHVWDVVTFQQKFSRKLPYSRENVCIAYDQQRRVYAVGSQSHVSIIDSRSLRHAMSIESRQRMVGVRSVGFNSNIVTIGTGGGAILFYDLMAGRYLDRSLQVGRGFLRDDDILHQSRRDAIWRHFFGEDSDFPNAVYTHCYDYSGTRLFAAGGPLPSGLWGNYAAVWQ